MYMCGWSYLVEVWVVIPGRGVGGHNMYGCGWSYLVGVWVVIPGRGVDSHKQ